MKRTAVDLSRYSSRFSAGNKLGRVLWGLVQGTLFRFSPSPLFAWRKLLLRCFGARIGRGAHVYPSVKVWAPWNLEMGAHSCLASHVDCYNVAAISLGEHATVSQYSYLCSATHDYEDPGHRLMPSPITIGAGAWVAADVFIGPGVTLGPGAVVGARASVFKAVPAWTVVVGNPAKPVRKRALRPRK